MIGSMGRSYGELEVGAVYRSRFGRTVLDADNVWFTLLTSRPGQGILTVKTRGLNQHDEIVVRVAEKLGERYERDVEVFGIGTRLFSLER